MCTAVRFSDSKGNLYLGRNLDWPSSYGQFTVITPRDFQYTSPFLGEQKPKNGALIGMAIIEHNIPLYFDCANESGLAVAGLNFSGYAHYATDAIAGKANVAAYEFPLWLAMNFATVDEAEAALKNVAIIDHPVSPQYPTSPLHWFIGDARRSIVVEYTENGLEIFHDDVDVLTNQPGYNWHRENLRNYMNLSSDYPKNTKWSTAEITPFGSGPCMRGLPGDYYPSSRFVRAAYLNTHYPTKDNEPANISRLFHTLASVSMIEGAAITQDGKSEATIYTSGYSSASKTYYYSTYDNPAIRSVSMLDHHLDSADLISVKE